MEMEYNLGILVKILEDWMKEADVYDEQKRKPISFNVINNNTLQIITPDAGKMIGKKGMLVSKYSKKFSAEMKVPFVKIDLHCPIYMVCMDKDETLMIYNNNNT